MSQFLAIYASVAKEDIRQNRDNVAERLGFLGCLIHGTNPRARLKELKERLGEAVGFAEAAVDWSPDKSPDSEENGQDRKVG